jgi:predicted transcriptional regulator
MEVSMPATVKTGKYPAVVSVRLPAEAAERLEKRAAADDRAPSAWARKAVLDALKRSEAGASSA